MPFDPKIPNNDLPLLPFNTDFRDPDILIRLGKTNVALARLNEQAKQIPNQKVLLDFISIREWVESNEIEGIHTTIQDVFLAELEKNKFHIKKADKETIRYREAINYGYNQIKERWFLVTNDYIKINNILLDNTAGIVSSPDKAIRNHQSNEILYTPPQWIDLIRDLLKNFEDHYNKFDKSTEIDPLLKLPFLHYQFEAIHPFGDGNGRTGRILIVLYLTLHEELDIPILFLSDFISTNKRHYYEFLHRIDSRDGYFLKEFLLWMLVWIEIQATKTYISISKIKLLMTDTSIQMRESPDLQKFYSKDLLDFLFIRPFYRIDHLAKYLKVHRNTATDYLNSLEKAGILKSRKVKRNRIFFFEDFLEALSQTE